MTAASGSSGHATYLEWDLRNDHPTQGLASSRFVPQPIVTENGTGEALGLVKSIYVITSKYMQIKSVSLACLDIVPHRSFCRTTQTESTPMAAAHLNHLKNIVPNQVIRTSSTAIDQRPELFTISMRLRPPDLRALRL